MLLASLSIAFAAETQIQLTGTHDRVLLAVPDGWSSYGAAGTQAPTGISLTPKPAATKDSPTVSIRVDVQPPGSCSASDTLVKSELTEFDQQQVSSSESVVINGKKAAIIHTRNDEADYLYVCVTLRQDRIFFELTVSSGSDPKFLQQYKRDFIWALQHTHVIDKSRPTKR